jgi:hypothetical protein
MNISLYNFRTLPKHSEIGSLQAVFTAKDADFFTTNNYKSSNFLYEFVKIAMSIVNVLYYNDKNTELTVFNNFIRKGYNGSIIKFYKAENMEVLNEKFNGGI